VIEMDEMYSYVGSKKPCWIWIAVDRLGKRFLGVVVGDRTTETGQCLWEAVAHHDIGGVKTDYWQPYSLFLPTENTNSLRRRPSRLKATIAYFGIIPPDCAVKPSVTLSP
jgi:IS1 family transposase